MLDRAVTNFVLFQRSGATLRNLICSGMQDAAQILKIMTEINAIPLALQITSIAGEFFQHAGNSRILIHFCHQEM